MIGLKGGRFIRVESEVAKRLIEALGDSGIQYVTVGDSVVEKRLVIGIDPIKESIGFKALEKPRMKKKPLGYWEVIRLHNAKKKINLDEENDGRVQ